MPAPSAEVCALIDEVLMPAGGEIAAQVAEAIHRHRDPIGSEDAEGVAATLASCEANIRIQLTIWRTGQDPSDAHPPEAALAYARLYAREGLPMAGLARAYRIGQEELMRILRHELESRLRPSELIGAIDQVSAFVFTYNDAVLERLEEAYRDEREECDRTAVALRRRMIAAILEGPPVDPAEASRQLGYDLGRNHLGAVFWGAGEGQLVAAARDVGQQLGASRHLTQPLGALALAAWFGSWEELDAASIALAPGVRCATGSVRRGYEGFRATHREALRTQRVASVCALPEGHVDYARTALAGLLCADPDGARAFMRAELGALLGEERPKAMRRLRETVAAYFDELASVSRTARRLGVHENTVQYRLHGAADLLGRPLQERPLELQLALAIARLLPPEPGTNPQPEE
jgi:DNA-binding PucR family transcriptional regulator